MRRESEVLHNVPNDLIIHALIRPSGTFSRGEKETEIRAGK